MTAAGAATIAFVVIVGSLYVAWSVRALQQWRKGRPPESGDPDIALGTWVWCHSLAAILGLAGLLLWLAYVAGWMR